MEKSRVVKYIIFLLIISVSIVLVLYSLSTIPLFNIEEISVYGVKRLSNDAKSIISELYHKNRFKIDFSEIENNLTSLGQIKSAKLSYTLFNKLDIYLEESDEKALITSNDEYYIINSDRIKRVSSSEAETLRESMCIIEVPEKLISYLNSYGITSELNEIIDLIVHVNKENDALISKIKYDNTTSHGFGQIVICLDSLSSWLYVRERVSKSRISDSIKVIIKESESDIMSYFKSSIIRYDLYKDVLVKRTV